jgi:hypothetical protein
MRDVIVNTYKFLVGSPHEKRPIRRLGVDGRIILKWIFEKSKM